MKAKKIILEIIIFLCALLFLYTAASKLSDVSTFYRQISNQVFPGWLNPYLTYGIPIWELLIGFTLYIKKTAKVALLAFTLTMLAFTVYVLLIVVNVFPRVPCGCASAFSSLSWKTHLWINGFYTAIGSIGLLLFTNLKKT